MRKRGYNEYEYDEYEDEEDYGRRPRRIWKAALILFLLLAALVAAVCVLFIKAPPVTKQPGLGAREPGIYTVLVAGRDAIGYNTDTIMICALDTISGTLNVVNIPRDTLVNVSWSVKKANSLLAGTGSPEGFVEGVGEVLGFLPDGYIIANMGALEAVVDTVGGVTFEVPVDMDYDDPAQDLYIHLSAGEQRLSGEEAMWVFRWRQNNGGGGYPTGDIGRIATQQALLTTIAQKALTPVNVFKAGQFLSIFSEYVETDLEPGNLAWYALQLLRLKDDTISFHMLPGNYGAYLNGLSYVAIYPEEWMNMVNLHLNPYQRDITQSDVNILTVDTMGNAYTVGG